MNDHYYADDDQKYLTFSLDNCDRNSAFSRLASCRGETKAWMAENFLQLNDSKTDAIVLHSKFSRKKPANIPLVIGSALVFLSDAVRNLGVILDSYLTMRKISRRRAVRHSFICGESQESENFSLVQLAVNSFWR